MDKMNKPIIDNFERVYIDSKKLTEDLALRIKNIYTALQIKSINSYREGIINGTITRN